jgi:hypothetical protein
MIQPVRDGNGSWVVPSGVSDFAALVNLAMDAVAQTDVERIVEFGRAWTANQVANQAIRPIRDTLAREIGQATFDRALAVWRAIR